MCTLSNDMVACTKKCANTIIKQIEVGERESNVLLNLAWDQDGKGGKDDLNNSMTYLLG